MIDTAKDLNASKGFGQILLIIILAAVFILGYLFLTNKLNISQIVKGEQVKGLSCQVRPPCPVTNPACQVDEPAEGWCPAN